MAEPSLKPEKDFTKEADQQIPEAEKLAKVCIHSAAQAYTCTSTNIILDRPTSRLRLKSLLPLKNKLDRSAPPDMS